MSGEDSGQARSSDGAPGLPELRQITDVRMLRALTHPVRIRLLEELTLGGAMTATEVGERIGESPTTCSFHLRQLAKYGFVEEAGGRQGRARPWRMTFIGMSLAGSGDRDAEIAADAAARLFRERWFARYQTWLEAKAAYPSEWRDAADNSEYVFYLTAGELKQLNQELAALLMPRIWERLTDPSKRPPGSAPVEMLLLSYPIGLPEPGNDDDGTQPHAGEDG